MTREELFRAVGEVREDQLTEAETKKAAPWRRYLAAAACLAVVLAAALALPGRQSADRGTGTDGSDYSTAEDAQAQPMYSVGAEIGELEPFSAVKPSRSEDGIASLAWLAPEEIFTMDTVIFRGTVRNLRYFRVEMGGEKKDYTVASVEVTDCIRGELEAGDIYNLLLPCGRGMSNTLAGDLENLETGSDAVFMPYRADAGTGWRSGEDYFCYADLAELYFDEGIRFLFLDTGDGLSFDREVYTDIAEAVTLEEVTDYLREAVPDAEL